MENIYNVILTYDISRAGSGDTVNAYVKSRMIELGYADRFINNETDKTVYLPNTTLIKEKTNCSTAREEVRNCVEEFNKKHSTLHEAERIFALKFDASSWSAIQGEPHKSESLAPTIK